MQRINLKLKILFLVFIILLSLICCSQKTKAPKISGKFIGSSESLIGPILVEVILKDSNITHINVLEYSDTPGYSDTVFTHLPQQVVDKNSTQIDAITGATITSKAFLKAVNDALKNAGLN